MSTSFLVTVVTALGTLNYILTGTRRTTVCGEVLDKRVELTIKLFGQ